MNLLAIVFAFAAGLGISAICPAAAEIYPWLLVLALLVALFGYGLAIPHWPILMVVILGMVAFFFDNVQKERSLRESPWMRAKSNQRSSSAGLRTELATVSRTELARYASLGLEHDRELAKVNRAILLGMRSGINRETREAFVKSGTIHVFAISGLHIMVVAKTLLIIFAFFFVPIRIAGMLVIPCLWGYVWMIGFPPSAVRAAVMASFYFGAAIFWRKPDGLRSLALAFLVMHLIRPSLIVDVGSLFSFTVMLTLILANRCLSGRGIVAALGMTTVAWAAGVPIAAAFFGRIALGGIVANLVLIAAASCSVAAGVVGMLLGWVSDSLAAHLNNLSSLFTAGMVVIAQLVARLPFSELKVSPWPLWECLLWYLALALGLWQLRKRERFTTE